MIGKTVLVSGIDETRREEGFVVNGYAPDKFGRFTQYIVYIISSKELVRRRAEDVSLKERRKNPTRKAWPKNSLVVDV